MSEPRRIETMSAAVGVSADKTKVRMTTAVPTARLSVPLTESTDDVYPEFSYVELLSRNSSEVSALVVVVVVVDRRAERSQ